MRHLLKFAVCTALALPAGAHAAMPDLGQSADQVFKQWATPSTPGCAVGMRQGEGAPLLRAYGMADLEHGVANTPDTVFEAGSASKQFTAAAILLLARDGKLALSDDVHKYLPALPDYGQPMTLEHLLTHTSGLRDWGSLVEMGGWPRGTRNFSMEQALELVQRQRALNFPSGQRFSYTNTGYVLLAAIVEKVSGKALPAFTRERLFAPLGMAHTQWRDNFRRVVAGRAIAYSAAGSGFEQDMPFEDVIGHGGLLTTVGDLLRWNQALNEDRLGISAQLAHKTPLPGGAVSNYGRGLGLRSYRGASEISHNGATAGYRSWLGRFAQQGLSIAVLCNAGNVNPDKVAHELAQAALALPPEVAPAALAAPEAPGYAGKFFSDLDGKVIELAYRDASLTLDKGPALRALGGAAFAIRSGSFVFADRDHFVSASPDGETVHYQHVAAGAPDATALAAFAGRYHSDEVAATYQLSVAGKALVFSLVGKADWVYTLTALAPDSFGGDDLLLRFKRDAGGHVIGLETSSARLFGLAFKKID
ncbi:MAG: serine hydrolase domain-containing protein [Pseudomonadota bacterium]